MNNYEDGKKFDYKALKDSILSSNRYDFYSKSPALLAGSKIINSSQQIQLNSEAIDSEFTNLKKQAFGSPDDIIKQELDKFRQQKDQLGIAKTDEEKLAEKFFLEIKYKEENERRARNEINEISQNLTTLEKFITSSKELEMKKEFKNALKERQVLFDLEKELYEEIKKFKDYYDQTEYARLNGKKLPASDTREKLQKMNDIKLKKEQIDYERQRIPFNIERIKVADFVNMKRKVSELLQNAENNRNSVSAIPHNNSTFRLGLDSLKFNINSSTDKLRELRKERNEFLENEHTTNLELESTLNPSPREKSNKAQQSLLSLNDDRNSINHNDQKLLDNPNYRQMLDDIEYLKNRQNNGSDKDPSFLKDLQKVEDLYRSLVHRTGNKLSPSKSDNSFAYLNVSKSPVLDNITPTALPGDAFSTKFSAFDTNTTHRAGNNVLDIKNSQVNFGNTNITSRNPVYDIKNGSDKINQLLEDGNQTLHDLQFKFANGNRITYAYNNPAFDRGVSDEENQLREYEEREKELLKTLNSLPVGSRLYQDALHQIRELAVLKAELEKIIKEQKLSKNSQQHQQQVQIRPPANDHEMNKRNISTHLKKRMFGVKLKGYDPNLGFIVNFEWISSLSKHHNYCQVLYGVHAGWEILASPALMSFHKCQNEIKGAKKCIFDEKYYIYDVFPMNTALLIFQIEVHYSPNLSGNDRVETLGWTMIDLFNWEGELKRGKWRLPVYEKPANTEINVEQIRFLRRIKDLYLYIRLLMPNDEDLLADGSRGSEALAAEHAIPEIHIRFWEQTKPLGETERPILITQVHHAPDSDDDSSSDTSSDSKDKTSETERTQENTEEEKTNNEGEEEDEEARRRREEEEEERKRKEAEEEEARNRALLEQQNQTGITLLQMKGIKVTVVGLKDYSTLNKFRVTGALMEGNSVLIDENGKACAFTTKAKILPNLNKTALDVSKVNPNMESRSQSVGLDEEVVFLKNLPSLIAAKQNKLDIILVFQLIECEYNEARDKTTLNTTKFEKTNHTLEELDENTTVVQDLDESNQNGYQIASWYAMKINKDDGTIQYGRFEKPLFFEPIVKPPFDELTTPKTETTIDFIIEEFSFDSEILAKHKKTKKKKNKGDTTTLRKKKEKKKEEWVIDPRPFIINTKRQYIDRPFEKGNGIDLYIDACRFLPDNVTVVKIVLNILTQSMEKIAPPQAALPELDSTTFSPTFKFKMELRTPHFDPTAIAFLSIETVDKIAEEVRTVGYCAMNLFINNKTKKPPLSESENDVILLNGLYQLPIFCQEPYKKRPFNMDRMVKLDKMPCASLLFRVEQAPKTEDGLKVLSKDDVPEKDWEKKKVWIPAPPYGAGRYNTSFCNVRDSEKELFYLRQQREDPQLRTTATILMNSEGVTHELNDEEILDWIDSKVMKTNSTEIIDLQYFAKYQFKSGFKFALDGFHNVPNKSIPYIGLYCLNPPASLYENPIDPTRIHLNSNYNWEDSAATSPQFLEGFVTFRDVKFDKNLTLIIDVRSVTFKKKVIPVFKNIGWTILPIFSSNGYVQSGIYQLPIFDGSVPKDVIEQLPVNDPWPYLMELMATKKSRIKYLQTMSAIVRLLDSQREGHFQKVFDYDRIDYRFLPKKKIGKYAYNVAADSKCQKSKKRLTGIVPLKGNPKEYNKNITAAFVQELGLHQYQIEGPKLETDQF